MTAKNWAAVLILGVALYFTGVLNRATQNKPAQAPTNTQIYSPNTNQSTDILTAPNPYTNQVTDILTAPNPYAASTFGYNKQQVTCTTGVDAYNQIVTTCEQ